MSKGQEHAIPQQLKRGTEIKRQIHAGKQGLKIRARESGQWEEAAAMTLYSPDKDVWRLVRL